MHSAIQGQVYHSVGRWNLNQIDDPDNRRLEEVPSLPPPEHRPLLLRDFRFSPSYVLVRREMVLAVAASILPWSLTRIGTRFSWPRESCEAFPTSR
jgi:hypothetical protein